MNSSDQRRSNNFSQSCTARQCELQRSSLGQTLQVTGLQNAKAILSGAELPEEGLLSTQASVAQTAPLSPQLLESCWVEGCCRYSVLHNFELTCLTFR